MKKTVLVGAVQPVVFAETHRAVKAFAALHDVPIANAYKIIIDAGLDSLGGGEFIRMQATAASSSPA